MLFYDISIDAKEFTAYKVTIANPNNKSFSCTTLIDNIFVSKKGKVSLYTQYNFLMEIILDYLYKIDDDPTIRNEFARVFNEKEIELLVSYFNHFPSFKKAIKEMEDG